MRSLFQSTFCCFSRLLRKNMYMLKTEVIIFYSVIWQGKTNSILKILMLWIYQQLEKSKAVKSLYISLFYSGNFSNKNSTLILTRKYRRQTYYHRERNVLLFCVGRVQNEKKIFHTVLVSGGNSSFPLNLNTVMYISSSLSPQCLRKSPVPPLFLQRYIPH